MSNLPAVTQLLLLAVTLVAAFFDLRWRRIPNWLTVTGVVCGFALNLILFEWAGLRLSALGLGLALLVYIPLLALRAMGGGDVKLMAAVGSITGPQNWFAIFLVTSILGGIVAVVIVLFKGRLGRTFSNLGFILWELAHLRRPYTGREELDIGSPKAVSLPHGAVISLGCVVFLLLARVASK